MYKDEVPGLEKCASHKEILNKIQEGVQKILDKDKEDNDG